MTIERAAWKGIYKMVREGHLSERESYDILRAVWHCEFIPVPMPQKAVDGTPDETPANEQITVKGFSC